MAAAAPSARDLAVLRSFARRIDAVDAGAHNNLGVLYYQKGLLDDAIVQFTRALDLDPRMQVAQANLALVSEESGSFVARMRELEAQLGRLPADREARWQVGRIHAALGRQAEAIREFETLLRWHPTDVPAMLQLGHAERARGHLDAAGDWFARAAALDPTNAAAVVAHGETLYHRARPEEAVRVLEDAVRRFPDFADGHHILSFLYGDLGRHEDARAEARRASALNPSLARAQANLVLARSSTPPATTPTVATGAPLTHFALGLAFRQKGMLEDALREYRLALDGGAEGSLARQGIAEVHLLRRELDAALVEYDALVATTPDSPKLWNERGVCLQHLGLVEQAGRSYASALAHDEAYALAWNNLGVLHAAQSQTTDAITALETALRHAPSLVAARLNLALARVRAGDPLAALVCYQAVLAQAPDNAIAWNGMGLLLMDASKFSEARAAFVRAVEADDHLAAAHYNLSFALSQLGEHDAALRATRRGLELEPYYVPQKFVLSIDVQYEHPDIPIPPSFNGDERLVTARGFTLDREALEEAFAALTPPVAAGPVEPPAADLLATARAEAAAGRLDRAETLVRRVRTPGLMAEAAILLGDLFARRGLHGEALERYRSALGDAPTERLAALGVLRSGLALGRGAEMADEANEAVRQHPEDAEVLAQAALVHVAAGDLSAALSRSRAAVQAAPQDAVAYDAVAEALLARGEVAGAATAIGRATELDPSVPRRWRRRGDVEAARGDVPAARTAYAQALMVLPTYADAALAAAALELRVPAPRPAIRLLAGLLAADPYNGDALAMLGRALLADGRAEPALVALDRALRLDPAHAEALLLRGEALARGRHFAPAIAAWERLLAVEPDAPVAAEARTRLRAVRDLQRIFAAAER